MNRFFVNFFLDSGRIGDILKIALYYGKMVKIHHGPATEIGDESHYFPL